jgi:hypothetical protein
MNGSCLGLSFKPETEMVVCQPAVASFRSSFSLFVDSLEGITLGSENSLQCGAPPVINWFINPINYSYKYHKPQLLEL